MNKTNTLVNAIFAGICIGIGCNVYLSCDNKYIGAILFTVGLIAILTFGFNLYTGKVGYLVAFGPKHINENFRMPGINKISKRFHRGKGKKTVIY